MQDSAAAPYAGHAPGFSRAPGWVEYVFVVFALLVFSGAGIFHISAPLSPQPGASGTTAQVVISRPDLLWFYLPIYLVAGLALLIRWRAVLESFLRERYIALLLLLAAVSTAWSAAPAETLAKTLAITGCTSFGVYCAFRFDTPQLLRLLHAAGLLCLVTTVVLALFYPEVGRMQGVHGGVWRGVFMHKNQLGLFAGLIALCSFLLLAIAERLQLLYLLSLALSVLVLIMACSKIALVSQIMVFSALAFYFIRRGRRDLVLFAAIAVFFTALALFLIYQKHVYPPLLVDKIVLGTEKIAPPGAKLETGKGRVRLWRELAAFAWERPVLGHGFGAFWTGSTGQQGEYWRGRRWYPHHAHNGLVDLWLQLGLLGVALGVMSVVNCCRRCYRQIAAAPGHVAGLFGPLLLLFLVVQNLTESKFFSANDLPWILYASVVFASVRAEADEH